jgi:hypothetical protein
MSFIKLNNQEIELDKIQEYISANTVKHIEIKLQSGPAKLNDIDGCDIQDVIFLCKEILSVFNENVPSRQIPVVITKLEEAIMWCKNRTEECQTHNIEGTDNP